MQVPCTLIMASAIFFPVPSRADLCSPNPCGSNTMCTTKNGRPTCMCLPGFSGNPLLGCQKGQCADTSECPPHQVCLATKCVDSCEGQCGINADCLPRDHIPVCSCPPGHTGDPLSNCRPLGPQELCEPSPCGPNSVCRVQDNVPVCYCERGYFGDPLVGCQRLENQQTTIVGPAGFPSSVPRPPSMPGAVAQTPSPPKPPPTTTARPTPKPTQPKPFTCYDDSDCNDSEKCVNSHCDPVCKARACGTRATCEPRNHQPICKCPPGMTGNPHKQCKSPNGICGDKKCGHMAKCAARNYINCNGYPQSITETHTECAPVGPQVVCYCPPETTGDPEKYCTPLLNKGFPQFEHK